MSKFKARYQVDDGYAGGSRPKYFNIDAEDLDDVMTELELRAFYDEMVYDAFEQNVTPFGENEDEFVEWAKQQIAERAK